MQINSFFYKFLLTSFITLITPLLVTMQNSSNNYEEASVLLITSWPSNPNTKYALLGRENYGSSKGHWDNFGGDKELIDNNKPLNTATRELQEETIDLLGHDSKVRNRLKNKSRKFVNNRKASITYITYFDHKDLENITQNFYSTRNSSRNPKNREKNALAWVNYESLKTVIRNAGRDATGKLITPIIMDANIIDSNNPSFKHRKKISITLRPFFVSKLQQAIDSQGKSI